MAAASAAETRLVSGTVKLARAGPADGSDDGTAGESDATGGVEPRWAGTGGIGSALPPAR
jgi:hypothetical protein